MLVSGRVRQLALALELRFIKFSAFVGKIPLIWVFQRDVTATVRVLDPEEGVAIGFSVQFKTPYLQLPVEVQKSLIGHEDADHRFSPSAFRFFDWQSWAHLDGAIEWQGERQVDIKGEEAAVVTGFTYRVHGMTASVATLGLRLAEGVEGEAWILSRGALLRVKFAPLYWMLEPQDDTFNVVAIRDTELATLVVSLSEIGSGNPRLYDKAVERLQRWAASMLAKKGPEKGLLRFLRHIRDWGPLGMQPLFPGLKDVLERLRIVDKERILFDFYADNWGMRDNRQGRLLAVKILEALATERALIAIEAISDCMKNQAVLPEEPALIQEAANRVKRKIAARSGG